MGQLHVIGTSRPDDGIGIEDAITYYMHRLTDQGKRPATVSSYQRDLVHFATWLELRWGENVSVASISRTDIRDFVAWMDKEAGLAPSTQNRRLAALRGFFEELQKAGFVRVDVMDGVKGKTAQRQSKVKWLTRQQAGRILHAIEAQSAGENRIKRDLALFRLLTFCGPRVYEVCGLSRTDVDLEHGVLTIRVGKGGKWRQVPIGGKTAEAIREYLAIRTDDHPALFVSDRKSRISTREVQHLCNKYGRMAGVDVTPHILRHTYAKQVLDQTGRLEYVASLLGHSSIETTRIYTTPSIREMGKVIDDLDR